MPYTSCSFTVLMYKTALNILRQLSACFGIFPHQLIAPQLVRKLICNTQTKKMHNIVQFVGLNVVNGK
jgi:hypothetical protein